MKKPAAKAGRREPPAAATPTRQAQAAAGAGDGGRDLVDVPEAVRLLGTTQPTFYRWLRSGRLKGMKVGRQWRFYRGDIEGFLRGESPRIDLGADIRPLLSALEGELRKVGAAVPKADDSGPVVRSVGLVVRLGLALGASDIHLEPYVDGVLLRYRIDGVLHRAATYDLRLHAAIVEQWKAMAGCDVHQVRRPQDGRALVASEGLQEPLDLRLSFLPAQMGEAVTVRVLRRDEVRLDLDRLGFQPRDREVLRRWQHAPYGLLVFTGPTGCGKTTTIYSALAEIVSDRVKILSVEDPVEYLIKGVTQMPVRAQEDVTFAAAIRGMLRADPDVMMVGEVRDRETLECCIQAALTGHLVLTTLHTDDAATALGRMLDIGADRFLVADAAKLVVSQRLVRMLCKACSAPAEPPAESLAEARTLARQSGLEWESLSRQWRRPVGCAECRLTGYRGRQVIAEALEVTGEIAGAIRHGASTSEIRALAIGQGMTTMAGHGVVRASAGETSLEEALMMAPRSQG
jgi:excisionase family DNA binding protein